MISIVTICYNERNTINRTIRSVYSQTRTDYEYIIKDALSDDGTAEELKKWEEPFRKKGISFKVISAKDKGIYDGMNTAVLQAEGDWILFLNAGDRFYSKKVLSEIFIAKDWSRTDLIYGDTAEEEYGELHLFRNGTLTVE